MLYVTPEISLDEARLSVQFIRAAGPGGQHVNKTSSAVQLRFQVAGNPDLPAAVVERLRAIAGHQLNKQGELVITAREHRGQADNRRAALQRLLGLIQRAARVPKARKATRPSRAARQRRLDAKRRQSKRKQTRGKVRGDD